MAVDDLLCSALLQDLRKSVGLEILIHGRIMHDTDDAGVIHARRQLRGFRRAHLQPQHFPAVDGTVLFLMIILGVGTGPAPRAEYDAAAECEGVVLQKMQRR